MSSSVFDRRNKCLAVRSAPLKTPTRHTAAGTPICPSTPRKGRKLDAWRRPSLLELTARQPDCCKPFWTDGKSMESFEFSGNEDVFESQVFLSFPTSMSELPLLEDKTHVSIPMSPLFRAYESRKKELSDSDANLTFLGKRRRLQSQRHLQFHALDEFGSSDSLSSSDAVVPAQQLDESI